MVLLCCECGMPRSGLDGQCGGELLRLARGVLGFQFGSCAHYVQLVHVASRGCFCSVACCADRGVMQTAVLSVVCECSVSCSVLG